jgi:murein DD-endopeptidase
MSHDLPSARLRIASLLLSLCLSATAFADAPAPKPVLSVPIQVSVAVPPSVFRADGRRHLAYEIQMTNLSASVWTIHRVQVRSESGASLLGAEGKEIGSLLRHAARAEDDKSGEPGALAPGESVIAYLWIDLGNDEPAPAELRHRFTVTQAGDETPHELDAPTAVVANKLPQIASPLRGKSWLAVNGPSNVSHHRRASLVLDGALHTSQRYAIDWVQVGQDLQTHRGDPKDNRNYLCFGSDVLAVADGVVVEVKDGIPENVPNAAPIVPITLETVAGNHIDLDLGGGVYAMYAHLQPGSLRVKLGDKVRRGQVLALVGNTGNSTEPHLHFQLMDRNSPLASDGLPYELPQFTVTRRITGDFEHPTATALAAAEIHRGEIPLEMELVDLE